MRRNLGAREAFFMGNYVPTLSLDKCVCVCYLMIASGSWNILIVYENFEFQEALSIQLLEENHDPHIWHFNLNGRYIVQSGH